MTLENDNHNQYEYYHYELIILINRRSISMIAITRIIIIIQKSH